MSDDIFLVSTTLNERAYGRWAERDAYRGTDAPYRLHCLMSEVFGGRAPLRPYRVVERPGRPRTILAYSRTAPSDIRRLARETGYALKMRALGTDELRARPVPRIRTGQCLVVSVLAAPHRRRNGTTEMDAHSVSGGSPERAARERSYAAWLAEKIERSNSARLLDATLIRWERTREMRSKNRPPILITRAEMTGVLEVRSEPGFRALLATGIGRHRAYGYGMLMIEGTAPENGR